MSKNYNYHILGHKKMTLVANPKQLKVASKNMGIKSHFPNTVKERPSISVNSPYYAVHFCVIFRV